MKIIDKILNDISLDERIDDGIFRIENNTHMEVLREYLIKKGIDENAVKEFSNLVLEKGKYPERQAWRVDSGILCTFPTPAYKAAAIKRGTHVDYDPNKKPVNVFPNEDPNNPSPTPKTIPQQTTEPKTNLPISQTPPTGNLDFSKDVDGGTKPEETPQPQAKTTAAPQQTPQSTSTYDEPDQEEKPPEKEKSPEEKEAEKNAIKTMLQGDDYILEQIIKHLMYNAPHLMEDIKRKMVVVKKKI